MVDWHNLPQFLTQQEVADLLQVHVNTVKRWRKIGQLKAYQIGHQWRIDRDDLRQFVEQQDAKSVQD